jgi:histidinol-phosphate aminotransferase
MSPTPKPGVLDISAYVGGRAPAPGRGGRTSCRRMNPRLGPSPEAVAAFEPRGPVALNIYPDGERACSARGDRRGSRPQSRSHRVRQRLGRTSDPAGQCLSAARRRGAVQRARVSPLSHRDARQQRGAVVVPEKNLRVDVDAMLARGHPAHALVYPRQSEQSDRQLSVGRGVRRLHAGLPPSTLLVIDAAYAEYVQRNDYEAGIEMVSQFDNVVMTRTFSKIYGLAGLRVGWAFCPGLSPTCSIACAGPSTSRCPRSARRGSLARPPHVEDPPRTTKNGRRWLIEHIARTGLRVDDSVGNFVLIHFPNPKAAHRESCRRVSLGARADPARRRELQWLPHCLRLTIGSEDANRRVAAALCRIHGQG